MIHGKLKINQNMTLSIIRVLHTKSKDFKKKFNYYLNSRRKYSASKIIIVKKIVNDVRKNKDQLGQLKTLLHFLYATCNRKFFGVEA